MHSLDDYCFIRQNIEHWFCRCVLKIEVLLFLYVNLKKSFIRLDTIFCMWISSLVLFTISFNQKFLYLDFQTKLVVVWKPRWYIRYLRDTPTWRLHFYAKMELYFPPQICEVTWSILKNLGEVTRKFQENSWQRLPPIATADRKHCELAFSVAVKYVIPIYQGSASRGHFLSKMFFLRQGRNQSNQRFLCSWWTHFKIQQRSRRRRRID